MFVTEEILCITEPEQTIFMDALLHSSMLTTDNTKQYHGEHPINGVNPSLMLLVFLTPRQVLSSHPHQKIALGYRIEIV